MVPPLTKTVREIKEFVPGSDFETYLERFEIYIGLNQVVEAVTKKNMFLHVIGQETYELLKKFARLSNKTPTTMTFEKCKKVLTDHLSPTRNEYLESFYFGLRNQKPGETVEEFAAELQILAQKCNYDTFLDRALREKFLIGLADRESARRILSEDGTMTFEKVVKFAKIFQEAGKTLSAVETRVDEVKALDVQNNRKFNGYKKNFNNGEFGKKKTQQAQAKIRRSRTQTTLHKIMLICTNPTNYNLRQNDRRNNGPRCYRCQGYGHFARFCTANQPRNLNLISESFVSDEWSDSIEECAPEVKQINLSNSMSA